MEKLKGQIQAVLSEKEISPDLSLIELINQRIQPPVDVTAEDIYIRAMYLVSDQVNSYGGRFPKEEQEQIAGVSREVAMRAATAALVRKGVMK